ncbi:glyoxalase [Rhodococcus sp. NPDC057014]|uniref:glyoxalase n=1 Tax=Rhodococcus sp. NPDC057014 TaxID=3346000 RepID=UPI0036387E09
MSSTDTRITETAGTTAATTFSSTADLTRALIRAAIAHGEHEKRTGAEDPNCGWYAAYMVAEQAGTEPPA